jgi:hypothetical protein
LRAKWEILIIMVQVRRQPIDSQEKEQWHLERQSGGGITSNIIASQSTATTTASTVVSQARAEASWVEMQQFLERACHQLTINKNGGQLYLFVRVSVVYTVLVVDDDMMCVKMY